VVSKRRRETRVPIFPPAPGSKKRRGAMAATIRSNPRDGPRVVQEVLAQIAFAPNRMGVEGMGAAQRRQAGRFKGLAAQFLIARSPGFPASAGPRPGAGEIECGGRDLRRLAAGIGRPRVPCLTRGRTPNA